MHFSRGGSLAYVRLARVLARLPHVAWLAYVAVVVLAEKPNDGGAAAQRHVYHSQVVVLVVGQLGALVAGLVRASCHELRSGAIARAVSAQTVLPTTISLIERHVLAVHFDRDFLAFVVNFVLVCIQAHSFGGFALVVVAACPRRGDKLGAGRARRLRRALLRVTNSFERSAAALWRHDHFLSNLQVGGPYHGRAERRVTLAEVHGATRFVRPSLGHVALAALGEA